MLEQAVYAGRNHALSLAVAAIALLTAAVPAHASEPVEVARLGFGSAFGALVAGPDGGAWVHISRFTTSLIENDPGLWDDAIGRASADNRFRRAATDGPVFGEGGALGPDGQVWFAGGLSLVRSDAAGTVTDTKLAEEVPDIAATGPDGTLWAADGRTKTLFRITAQGAVTKAPLTLPACELEGSFTEMRAAADGAVWIADPACRRLVRLGPDGAPSVVVLTRDDDPVALAADAAGGIWFAQRNLPSGVAHVDAAGTIRRHRVPAPHGVVSGIAATADGGAYLAFGRCVLGRLAPDGALTFGAAPVPAELLAVDPAGGLWLASAARLVHAPAPPLARDACDDRPPAVRLSPGLRDRVSLGRLRRGVRITVREPAFVYASADYGEDDHDTHTKLVRTRKGGAMVFRLPPQTLRRFRRELDRGGRPELSLYVEVSDRDGNSRLLEQEVVRVTR